MVDLLRPEARDTLRTNRTPGWVEDLPGLIVQATERWSLTLEPHFDTLSYNYVAPVRTSDGVAAVLKLVPPNDIESLTELEALKALNGDGFADLIDVDVSLGAALIERLVPGLALSSLHDDVAETAVAAQVMLAIRRDVPAQHGFPSMRDWFDATMVVNRRRRGIPPWLEAGHALAISLLDQTTTPMLLLHGDLHHDNILSSQRGWLAIDPKGVVGEAVWEVGAYLYNNLPDGQGETAWRRTIRRRADQFAEALDLDRERAHACAAAYAVLSAAWSLQEHDIPQAGFKPLIAASELAAIPY